MTVWQTFKASFWEAYDRAPRWPLWVLALRWLGLCGWLLLFAVLWFR